MAKLIISGEIKEEDIWLIAKFFREYWKHRPEKLFLWVEGVEGMSKEEVEMIFAKIFTDDKKDWTIKKLDSTTIDKFKESLK